MGPLLVSDPDDSHSHHRRHTVRCRPSARRTGGLPRRTSIVGLPGGRLNTSPIDALENRCDLGFQFRDELLYHNLARRRLGQWAEYLGECSDKTLMKPAASTDIENLEGRPSI